MPFFKPQGQQWRNYIKWTGGTRFKSRPFLYRKYEGGIVEPKLHDTVYKNSKNENILINNTHNLKKMYSFNNMVILCSWICVLMSTILITNVQNKQTLEVYNFFWIMHSFPNTGAESCLEKNLEYKSILYNSTELSFG